MKNVVPVIENDNQLNRKKHLIWKPLQKRPEFGIVNNTEWETSYREWETSDEDWKTS